MGDYYKGKPSKYASQCDTIWDDMFGAETDDWVKKDGYYESKSLKRQMNMFMEIDIPPVPCVAFTKGEKPREKAAWYLHMANGSYFIAWILMFIYGLGYLVWAYYRTLKAVSAQDPVAVFGSIPP